MPTNVCHLVEFMTEHEIPDTEDECEIPIKQCHKRCGICNKYVLEDCTDYYTMSGHTLHEICRYHKNNTLVEKNLKIWELRFAVIEFDDPLEYLVYDRVRYGNPELFIDIE